MDSTRTDRLQTEAQLPDNLMQSRHFLFLVTDKEGQLLITNNLFREKFFPQNKKAGGFLFDMLLTKERMQCRKKMNDCLLRKGTMQEIDLHMLAPGRRFSLIRWEMSTLPASFLNSQSPETIQWTGIDIEDVKNQFTTIGTKVGSLPERFKAYETSTGGLWRFDLRLPVSCSLGEEEIITHFRQHSFLAECNDNMARMYGYEKAEELIGAGLNDLMDFSDPVRLENLKKFVKRGFQSTMVETKEFDKNGNTKYFLNNMTGTIENGMVMRVWGTQQDITEQRLAEEKIRHLGMLMEHVSDIIISQDKDYLVVSWNKAAEEVYGYTAEEMIGRRVSDRLNFEFQGISRDQFFKTLDTTGSWNGEAYTINKYGKYLTVLAAVTQIRNEAGEPTGYVSISKNITERKKSEDQLRRQAIVLNNVSDLIMTTDFDLTILSWNKKAEEVVGYTAAETIGKFLGDIVRPDYGKITPHQSAEELEKNGFWQGEVSFINKYGQRKHVLHTASYLLDESGKRIAIIGTGKDITEKKKAEEQLKQSELFYRNLIAESLDGIVLTDENGIASFVSPSVSKILGYHPDEILRRSVFEFVYPGDLAAAQAAFSEEINLEQITKFVSVRLKTKTGDWVWCYVRGHNMLHNPYVGRMVIYFYDDSRRKNAEDALTESQQKLSTQANIIQHVSDVIVTGDLNYVITSWNNIAEEMTGFTATEAIGKNFWDIIPLDYSPFAAREIAAILLEKDVWRGEVSLMNKWGEKKVHLHTISFLYDEKGNRTGYLVIGKDITERKKIETRLTESESFYRNLIANSLDGIVLTNREGLITYCSPSVIPLSGYNPADIIGHHLFEFVHPDDMVRAQDAFVKEMARQSVLYFILLRLRHSNGDWVWCSVRGHNFFDNPAINSMVVYFTDETVRKETEDRLRESEKRFRNLIHDLNLGVLVQNEKSEMLICNQAALDMLGLAEEQLLGASSFDPRWNVIHEDGTNFPGEDHPVPAAIRTKQSVRDVVMGVFRPVTNDRVWLLVNAEPVLDENNNIINVVCSFTDITEQKRITQELIDHEVQKQKLLTQATIDGQEQERLEIGRELHDNISQHLTTTRLYLEVAKEKATGEVNDMINYAHKNLSDIINQIRHLSQSLVPPSLGDLGLIESVQDLCDSLGKIHTFQIEFYHRHFSEKDLPDNMKLMFFRIIQEQINNIVRHAGATLVSIKLQADAEHIILTVSDNGRGFNLSQYKKGVGFTSIFNRAALFNGKMSIDTSPGQGTTLTITVPAGNVE